MPHMKDGCDNSVPESELGLAKSLNQLSSLLFFGFPCTAIDILAGFFTEGFPTDGAYKRPVCLLILNSVQYP